MGAGEKDGHSGSLRREFRSSYSAYHVAMVAVTSLNTPVTEYKDIRDRRIAGACWLPAYLKKVVSSTFSERPSLKGIHWAATEESDTLL